MAEDECIQNFKWNEIFTCKQLNTNKKWLKTAIGDVFNIEVYCFVMLIISKLCY